MMKLAILLVVGVITGHVYGDEPEPIVGGSTATRGQFPHQISLQHGGRHICGGSIISVTRILTAAHCVEGISQASLKVITGAHLSINGDGQRHDIQCIKMHRGYTGRQSDGWKNDIAIIILRSPIRFNNLQKSIPIASRDYATGANRGVISGWGKTSVNSDTASYLQWTTVGVLSTTACLQAHPNRGNGGAFTNPKHICTLAQRGIGACQGDSGGPLVINGELCGVTSWVSPCALGIADVFTSVYHYRDFISSTTTC